MKFYRPTLDEVLDGRALTTAETRLLASCKTGEAAICGNAVPDAPHDENEIDAALIRYLLLGGCEAHQPHPSGVLVIGGYISGVLNFVGCETALTLYCNRCQFSVEPNFRDAEIGQLNLYGSHFPSFNGHRMRVKRSVLMKGAFKALGTVDLSSATIGGVLDCNDGSFVNPNGNALNCSGLRVGSDVMLNGNFKSTGRVNLAGATIDGQFDATGGLFYSFQQDSLNCDAMIVGAEVFFCEGFEAVGRVNLRGAKIEGQLNCKAGKFDGTGRDALNCNAIQVGGSVLLCDGFKATGRVNLLRATIEGQLDGTGGNFDGEGQTALNCNSIRVGADVFLYEGFKSIGQVDLSRSKISGNLNCFRAEICGSFIASSMSVGLGFIWRDIRGEQPVVSLVAAQVGGLQDDANSWEKAIQLNLHDFKYASLDNMFTDFSIDRRLKWLDRNNSEEYKMHYSQENSTFFHGSTERFEPNPYIHLARLLEANGLRLAAAKVRATMEKKLRRSEFVRLRFSTNGDVHDGLRSVLADLKRPFDTFWGKVFGYGHLPFGGILYALCIIISTSLFYGTVYENGQFAPNSDIILTSAEWRNFADYPDRFPNPAAAWSASKAGTDYESFSAIGYGLDLFLPLDALGQEAAWAPSKDRGSWGYAGFYLRWVVQFLGWVFTGVLAAALTGIIGRKE